jgi:type I restriction enzyme, S subunit
VKNGWQTKKLGEVATLQRGFDLPTQNRVRGNVPLVSSSGISDTHSESAVRGPGVVTGRSGSIGNVFFIREDFWPLNTVLFVKDFHGNDPRFVFYLLKNFGLNRFASGSGVPTLNRNFVHGEEVTVPRLSEQKRIVGVLDEAFDGIATATANAERNLENARALFQRSLEAVFAERSEEWEEKRLGDIASVKGGKRVPKGYKLLVEPTDFPYLRVADFTDSGSIAMDDLRYVSAEVHQKIRNYVISSSDLYLSIAGTIGKTGIVPGELDGANLTENACRLVFRSGISNRFVYYFTLTRDFIGQAGLNTRTAAQPKLALSRLSTIKIRVPSLAMQESVVESLDALRAETRRLESIYHRKLTAFEALGRSLLHQALTGAFQDWHYERSRD